MYNILYSGLVGLGYFILAGGMDKQIGNVICEKMFSREKMFSHQYIEVNN